jgi:hypothetical protein
MNNQARADAQRRRGQKNKAGVYSESLRLGASLVISSTPSKTFRKTVGEAVSSAAWVC